MTSMAPVIFGEIGMARLNIYLADQHVFTAATPSVRAGCPGELTHAQLHGKLFEVDGMIVGFDLVGQGCSFLEQVCMPGVEEFRVSICLETNVSLIYHLWRDFHCRIGPTWFEVQSTNGPSSTETIRQAIISI